MTALITEISTKNLQYKPHFVFIRSHLLRLRNIYSNIPVLNEFGLPAENKKHHHMVAHPCLCVLAVAFGRSCRLRVHRWQRSLKGCQEPGSALLPWVPLFDCWFSFLVLSLSAQLFWGQGPQSHNLLWTLSVTSDQAITPGWLTSWGKSIIFFMNGHVCLLKCHHDARYLLQ